MNTFAALYSWRGHYGSYEKLSYVIIANTQNEALGLALDAEPTTTSEDWEITEVDNTSLGAHYMMTDSN